MLPTTSVHVLEQHPKQFRQPCRRCISGIRETGFFYSWPLSSVSHIFTFLDRMQPSLYVLTSLFAFSLLLSSQLMLCLLLDVCDFFGLFFVLLFLCVCGFSLFCHFLLVFNLLFVKIKKIKDKKKFLFRQVNNNSHLLPNITLGVEIRDDCGTVNTALEQCLNFFVGTLANNEQICSLSDSSFRVQRRAVLGGVVGPSFSTTTIQVSMTCMLADSMYSKKRTLKLLL